MDILDAFIIIFVAALIHASFQLSVSVLTLLSGHAIGQKRSHAKLLRLMGGYLGGVATMTLLVLSFLALVILNLTQHMATVPLAAWVGVCGLLLGLGVAVWAFYYRSGRGTALWLPRELSAHLSDRTKATKRSAEAFSLGLTSVIAELLFIVVPMLVAALVLVQLAPFWQLLGLTVYTLVSMTSLLTVSALVGGGNSLGRIQKWRETNKSFLQFAGGAGLIVLGFYLYVDQITAVAAAAGYGG